MMRSIRLNFVLLDVLLFRFVSNKNSKPANLSYEFILLGRDLLHMDRNAGEIADVDISIKLLGNFFSKFNVISYDLLCAI